MVKTLRVALCVSLLVQGGMITAGNPLPKEGTWASFFTYFGFGFGATGLYELEPAGITNDKGEINKKAAITKTIGSVISIFSLAKGLNLSYEGGTVKLNDVDLSTIPLKDVQHATLGDILNKETLGLTAGALTAHYGKSGYNYLDKHGYLFKNKKKDRKEDNKHTNTELFNVNNNNNNNNEIPTDQ